jgi:octopine/nopaline transport system permease protein
MMDFGFLWSTELQLLAAVPVTLELFAASITLGAVLGLGLIWMRLSGVWPLAWLARGSVFIFRGSPLLIQMFLIYYGLGQFAVIRESFAWPLLRDAFPCAVLSLALCTAGYQAEIFRGGLQAVPFGQIEAGRACGMTRLTLLRRIILPIALRQALPAYSTEMVLMVKSTSLASLVTVWEVTGVAQQIISETYQTMEVFCCAAVIYLAINFCVIRSLGALEYVLSGYLRAARTR